MSEPAISLRVAELSPRDAGRGLVRVDPAVMEELKVSTGEIVEIWGKRVTAARVLPAFAENRGQGILQADRTVRENTRVSLGDKVELKKAEANPALEVLLTANNQVPQWARSDRNLCRLMEGLPVVAGDRVRVSSLGAYRQEFQVLETTPQGAVVVTAQTRIRIQVQQGGSGKEGKVIFEEIGGLEQELGKIREMIELPLKYPELFERLGIDAPKGVLLSGPPGTGKTLIARAVAGESDARFFHINGPEIMGKYYGESEGRLREIFEQAAAQAPSIIFLDELDAIAPKREEVHGEVEKRVVAQLLGLMDGLKPRGQVVIIGATNIPNALDPALRRPGRFDREITIGVPGQKGRLEILQIHTRGMPLGKDVNLEKLAGQTHGFVGADLQALCQEAAMNCVRRMLPGISGGEEISGVLERLWDLQICQEDFLSALKEVEPSATREVAVEVPRVSWDEVGGLEDVKQHLVEAVQWPLKHAKLFERARLRAPKGILLAGPPGTGKTLLAKAVATESGANFLSVKGPALLSKWLGESEKGVREIFRKARQVAPSIVFFDELDALVPVRGSGENPAVERVLSQLLTEMDGVEELQGVVVLAATNRLDMIDPALLRPGRFDIIVNLPLPDLEGRREIFQVHLRNKPLAPDVCIEELARVTEGYSGAGIQQVCQQAGLLAVRGFLSSAQVNNCFQPEDLCGLEEFQIRGEHFWQTGLKLERVL